MQKKQINKLRMFSAVDLVLTNNQSLFATVDDLTNGHERLRVGLELIGQRRLVQETDNTG